METQLPANYKTLSRLILLISIALPLIVGILFGIKIPGLWPYNPYVLPAFNAFINGSTAFVLLAALVAIKANKIKLHSNLIYLAMGLSLLFLVGYVLYHITTEHTKYAGDSAGLYYSLLFSHIVLAGLQPPFVLYAFLFGYTKQWDKHKRLVKLAYPIWLYVSITGVICYKMIAPFYPG